MIETPRIHHVMTAIPPGSEEFARSFYVGLLGFCEVPKPSGLVSRGGVWLSTGSIDLHLGVDPDFLPSRKAHIALLVKDLDMLRERLLSVEIDLGPVEFELPGFRRCYVADPFGNRLELMQSL